MCPYKYQAIKPLNQVCSFNAIFNYTKYTECLASKQDIADNIPTFAQIQRICQSNIGSQHWSTCIWAGGRHIGLIWASHW